MSTTQVTIERDVIDRRIPMGRLRDTSAVIKRNLLQYIRVRSSWSSQRCSR